MIPRPMPKWYRRLVDKRRDEGESQRLIDAVAANRQRGLAQDHRFVKCGCTLQLPDHCVVCGIVKELHPVNGYAIGSS